MGFDLARAVVGVGTLALALGACHRSVAPPMVAADPLPAVVFEPPGLAAGERVPAVIVLHGLGGSGQRAFERLELESFGRQRRLFVVAPDGAQDRQGRRFWNAGGACCNFDRVAIDDVARLTSFIDRWRRNPHVDPRRVYVIGYSNGGFMVHRLACAAADRLAAVASIAGAGVDPSEPCAVRSPLGVLEIHGDRDPIVRYEGGRVFDDPALAAHPSAEASVRAWAARLGCAAAAADSGEGHASMRIERHDGCRLGSVELWTIPGADHDIASPELVAAIWDFLSRFSQPMQ
jgi:polyhydroxybutyrate depolymerase